MEWNLIEIKKTLNNIDWKNVTPSKDNVLKAFSINPKNVKVVIVGQDPYPTPGVANGLAFAINKVSPAPMSLKNIFSEIVQTNGFVNADFTLEHWVNQGVMLINKNLTTKIFEPNAHELIWQDKVFKVLTDLANYNSNVVWILWGASAAKLIDYLPKNSIIIKDAHPSPLSFHRRNHDTFTKIKQFVKIDW